MKPSNKSEETLNGAQETAQQKSQEAEESRRILNAIIEYLPEQIVVVEGPERRVKIDSKYCGRFTGMREESMVGKTNEERLNMQPFYHLDGVTRAELEEMPITRVLEKGAFIEGEDWVIYSRSGEKIVSPLLPVPSGIKTATSPGPSAPGGTSACAGGWKMRWSPANSGTVRW